jgi:hypothetical protein
LLYPLADILLTSEILLHPMLAVQLQRGGEWLSGLALEAF